VARVVLAELMAPQFTPVTKFLLFATCRGFSVRVILAENGTSIGEGRICFG